MKTIKTAEEHITEHLNKIWKEGFNEGKKDMKEDVLGLIDEIEFHGDIDEFKEELKTKIEGTLEMEHKEK